MFFFFNHTATTEIYTLSLHDALPICFGRTPCRSRGSVRRRRAASKSGRPIWRWSRSCARSEERRVGKECIGRRVRTQSPQAAVRGEPGVNVGGKSIPAAAQGKSFLVRWSGFLFFFSSRRRHTSLTCDWSSDVCSSDLLWPDAVPEPRIGAPASRSEQVWSPDLALVEILREIGRASCRERVYRPEGAHAVTTGGRSRRARRERRRQIHSRRCPGQVVPRPLVGLPLFFFKQKTAYELDM